MELMVTGDMIGDSGCLEVQSDVRILGHTDSAVQLDRLGGDMKCQITGPGLRRGRFEGCVREARRGGLNCGLHDRARHLKVAVHSRRAMLQTLVGTDQGTELTSNLEVLDG